MKFETNEILQPRIDIVSFFVTRTIVSTLATITKDYIDFVSNVLNVQVTRPILHDEKKVKKKKKIYSHFFRMILCAPNSPVIYFLFLGYLYALEVKIIAVRLINTVYR